MSSAPLLRVDGLSVAYPMAGGLLRRAESRLAVDDISFEIEAGKTFGLVGESGSGKSTVGRAILRLIAAADGLIEFDGHNIAEFGRQTPMSYRRSVQVVFQNPATALNPSWTVEDILAEPLRLHRDLDGRKAVRQAIDELCDQVGLSRFHQKRYPWELSGGQCQRVAIARALAARPRLIICDEPVSALDVSTQSQVINLLEELQNELGIAYLFVAHDLSVVRHISHDVGVMYAGRLLEVGPAEQIYTQPAHPYTQSLLAAIPIPDPVLQRARRAERRRTRLDEPIAEIPAADSVGCPFQTRCPVVMDVCRTKMPQLLSASAGSQVACHRVTPVDALVELRN